MSNSSVERTSDLSFLYSRSKETPKYLFSRYLQTSVAQVLYVCVLILMEDGINAYSEIATTL